MAINDYPGGRFIFVNNALLSATGYGREEAVGRLPVELGLWQNPKEIKKIMRTLEQEGVVKNQEIAYVTKKGEVRQALYSAEIIEIEGDLRLLSTVNDITELKQMQQEVARLERFNLVGQMAAGIGHEIRNPMTAVRGFLQILGSKRELAPYQAWISLMIEELDRANSIITEFLSLAKNKSVNFQLLNINEILRTIAPLIEADALNGDKYIAWNLADVPAIMLNPEEIRQLVLNLTRNGLEAMDAGGCLTIKTFSDGPELVLAVQDCGGGIAPEVLAKLGTPFVSTKESGTGLGLPVCYAIAARHHATINVQTGSGGTTFFVRFRGRESNSGNDV